MSELRAQIGKSWVIPEHPEKSPAQLVIIERGAAPGDCLEEQTGARNAFGIWSGSLGLWAFYEN